MNKISYYNHPLYVNEALYLLSYFANDENITLDAPKFVRANCDAHAYIDSLMALKQTAHLKSLAYFKYNAPTQLSIGYCLFCFLSAFELQESNAKEKLAKTIDTLIHGNVSDISFTNCLEIYPGNEVKFIDKFLSLNISNDFKVELLKHLLHPQATLDLIWEDINALIPYLKKIYQHYNTQDQLTYYTKEKINNLVSSTYQNKSGECVVIPSLTHPTRLALNIGDENPRKQNPITFLVGVLLDNEKIEDSSYQNDDLEQKLSYFLKAINDPSKMKIIDLLKHKDMYGAQIAQSLNLTTPTVSHHMDTLLNSGIVSARKENNRMNYRYNKDKCNELMTYLKDKLS